MKVLLFTKDIDFYASFIARAEEIFEDVKIVYPETHPRKKDENYEEFIKDCSEFEPDLIISFFYSRVIQRDLYEMPELAINFHPSLLPNYAGSHALNWQLWNGEKEGGVTVHELEAGIDEGQILYQIRFPIDEENIVSLLKKSIKKSERLLLELKKDIKTETLQKSPQKKTGTEFMCVKRTPADGEVTKEFSPLQIQNASRALAHPWPGIFYYTTSGKQITINREITDLEARSIWRALNGE